MAIEYRSLANSTLLQIDDEGGFIRFFRNLPTKDDGCIRIFDRGDWYTAHGDDAVFVARTVSINWLWRAISNNLGA